MEKINQVKEQYGTGNDYKVVYWESDERREEGLSDIYELDMSLEDAVSHCERLVQKGHAVSAEVRLVDEEETTIFYCGPDDKDIETIKGWQV